MIAHPFTARSFGARRTLTLCLGASILGGLAAPTAAWAEAAPDAEEAAGLAEIVVVARKREALGGEDLTARGASALADVAGFVPNVSMYTAAGGSGGGANLSVFIRGVGQSEFLFTVDPGVGVYVDGVYYPRSVGSTFDLLDVERVEVLRGPQGTLFGKNTIGGAVNVTSAKPDGQTRGFIEVTTGRFNRIDLRGSFETALVPDQVAMKLSVSSQNRDGYGKRVDYFTGETVSRPGDIGQTAARLDLRFTPSSDVTVDIAADYSRWRQEAVPEKLLSFDQDVSLVATLWNIFVASPIPMSTDFMSSKPFTTFGTGPNRNDLDMWGVSGTINWDMNDAIALKSVTAYRHMKAHFGRDGDGGPVDYIATDNRQRQHQFSQEIQLVGTSADDRLKWVVGGFYFDEYGRDTNNVILASGFFNAFEGLPGPATRSTSRSISTSTSSTRSASRATPPSDRRPTRSPTT